ncbi:hypothetical protein [Marinimicrobium koreense]|uniref:hypothetical protein n=1 Tax=Marinimicrobium koreense TaxID=306545 RepID=UPI000F4D0D0C|nr:hypothetical protein [Marinimicrobium koreense]
MNVLISNRFSILFTLTMVIIAVVSLLADVLTYDGNNWFQRSGSLLVLAGAELQYSSIRTNWQRAQNREREMPSFDDKIAEGKGISVTELYEDLAKTRNFSIEIHEIITAKSLKQVIAIVLIVAGTGIWGYADIPFQ